MVQSVSEGHAELYHYTTAAGLFGILKSQQLRATHIGHLNDAEEHIGFFRRRLPSLLEKPAREAVAELLRQRGARPMIENLGGEEKVIADLCRDLSASVQQVTIGMDEPYVASFCSVNAHTSPGDGLLSQWRGYGVDGGYALVFDTKELERMVGAENEAFFYQFGAFGDVDYDYPTHLNRPALPERLEWEAQVQESFRKFILTQQPQSFDELHAPMAALASRYKHHGFSEEHEVRLVFFPVSDKVYEQALQNKKPGQQLKPRKPILFEPRGGILRPYIMLLGGAAGPTGKLPVRRIIVGPHPDREKRASAARLFLRKEGIDADVIVSATPYLGH